MFFRSSFIPGLEFYPEKKQSRRIDSNGFPRVTNHIAETWRDLDHEAEGILLSGNDIRSTFLKFFGDRGHRIVRSSSLVPVNDPTLLFTNAGMNQFKDVFLGLEQRDYTRATTSQKCVRAGGKHNDLENVGFTNRHHTFFEMLGNFSFGDYFKKDAVAYAWELVTSPAWFGIPVDKLTFTVFGGAEIAPGKVLGIDEEARELWIAAGAPRDRVIPVPGLKENFWAMGDTGPCGPCSEIHYDMGPAASDKGHTDCKFGCECGRYVEIWNLVFMQFNRDESGTVAPLPKPSIDTGAGLERLAAVLQGKISNFDTDLFTPLINMASKLVGINPDKDAHILPSLRIIADHSRATAFLISDGVQPSNEGRGYTLRKIMRRAIRHAHMWGQKQPFLFQMIDSVRDVMKDAYPELREASARISEIVLAEEKQYGRTVVIASEKLEELIRTAKADAKRDCLDSYIRNHDKNIDREWGKQVLDDILPEKALDARRSAGQWLVLDAQTLKLQEYFVENYHPFLSGIKAFHLYETYGLPLDFIEDAARDFGITFGAKEKREFDGAMLEERTRARASWKGGHKGVANPVYGKLAETYRTEPDFYFETSAKNRRIEAIVTKDGAVNELPAGAEGEIVLDRTVFYAESGGQVSDIGTLWNNEHTMQIADVRGAYYPVSGLIAHRVVAKEKLVVGDLVAGDADGTRREHIKRNHTATHLMHAALRNILGTHVKQAGSLVEPGRLRFDFSHFAAIDAAELRDIEQQVNDEILLNSEVQTNVTTIDDALASGALAFFGDRYPEQNVRVVTIPDPSAPRGFYSKELCGGTHVRRTGDIGLFKIAVEQSAAAGVRRIEAITGTAALGDYQRAANTLNTLAQLLNVGDAQVLTKIDEMAERLAANEKYIQAMSRKQANSKIDDLVAQARTIKGVKVISAEIEGVDRETMRQLVDSLRQKLGSGVVVLGAIVKASLLDRLSDASAVLAQPKVALLAGVTKDLASKLHAGKIIQATAKLVGGSGGGRPDLAEAGGKDTSGLKTALDHVYLLIDQLL